VFIIASSVLLVGVAEPVAKPLPGAAAVFTVQAVQRAANASAERSGRPGHTPEGWGSPAPVLGVPLPS
jgi:hypothetical protein